MTCWFHLKRFFQEQWNIFIGKVHSCTFMCILWCIPVGSSAFRCISVHYGAFLCIPVHFSALWCIPVYSGAGRCMPVHSGAFWSISVHSGVFRCMPMHTGAFRSISVHSTVFLCMPVHPGAFRSISVHLGARRFSIIISNFHSCFVLDLCLLLHPRLQVLCVSGPHALPKSFMINTFYSITCALIFRNNSFFPLLLCEIVYASSVIDQIKLNTYTNTQHRLNRTHHNTPYSTQYTTSHNTTEQHRKASDSTGNHAEV